MKAIGLVSRMLLPVLFVGCVTNPDDDQLPDDPVEDPGPGPIQPTPDPPSSETLGQATERVLTQWTDCMTIEDFQSANMANAWARMPTVNNSQCQNCHVSGGEGFIATTQAQLMFDALKQNRYLLLQYVTVDLTNGSAEAKVIPNRLSFKAVATGQTPHAEHPRFDENGQGKAALDQWYQLVQQRITVECPTAPPPT